MDLPNNGMPAIKFHLHKDKGNQMKDVIIIKSIFLFASIWGLSLFLMWFRPRIEIFWKISATVLYAFYGWFFYSEIVNGFREFMSSWYLSFLAFFKELFILVFVNLFFLWPVALVLVYFKADEIGAEKLLRFMCLLTIALWIIFVLYYYFSSGIDSFLLEKLKEMVPGA